jgi:hypothetical protein
MAFIADCLGSLADGSVFSDLFQKGDSIASQKSHIGFFQGNRSGNFNLFS